MDTFLQLPDARSPTLYLTHPTASEYKTIYSLSFLAWGDALSLPQYLEESVFLTTIPLAKDDGMHVWMLTDRTISPDHRLYYVLVKPFASVHSSRIPRVNSAR